MELQNIAEKLLNCTQGEIQQLNSLLGGRLTLQSVETTNDAGEEEEDGGDPDPGEEGDGGNDTHPHPPTHG